MALVATGRWRREGGRRWRRRRWRRGWGAGRGGWRRRHLRRRWRGRRRRQGGRVKEAWRRHHEPARAVQLSREVGGPLGPPLWREAPHPVVRAGAVVDAHSHVGRRLDAVEEDLIGGAVKQQHPLARHGDESLDDAADEDIRAEHPLQPAVSQPQRVLGATAAAAAELVDGRLGCVGELDEKLDVWRRRVDGWRWQ